MAIAQWLERLACNLRVPGSIPGVTAATSANPVVLNYNSCIGGLYTPFNWCERCGAAAQGIGEAIPKTYSSAMWWQHFGGSPRRLNKPAVYDHTGRKHATKNQKKPKP